MTEPATPFERLGGEAGVRQLVDRFYDLMDLEPVYAGIRALHPSELDGSRDKLFWFLCGWLAGWATAVHRPLWSPHAARPASALRHWHQRA